MNIEPMRLRDALKYYGICLGIFVASVLLATLLPQLTFVPVLTYLGCGWFMNRRVLFAIVELNIIHDTLMNMLKIKMIHLVFWIIRYPILLVQLLIAKKF